MLNGELGNKIPAISKPYLFSAREDAPSNFDQEYGVHFGCKCDSVIYFLMKNPAPRGVVSDHTYGSTLADIDIIPKLIREKTMKRDAASGEELNPTGY